jgi:hypothetical protein
VQLEHLIGGVRFGVIGLRRDEAVHGGESSPYRPPVNEFHG